MKRRNRTNESEKQKTFYGHWKIESLSLKLSFPEKWDQITDNASLNSLFIQKSQENLEMEV